VGGWSGYGVEWVWSGWSGVEWSGEERSGVEWSGVGWSGVEWRGVVEGVDMEWVVEWMEWVDVWVVVVERVDVLRECGVGSVWSGEWVGISNGGSGRGDWK